jgi:hypothetical protein
MSFNPCEIYFISFFSIILENFIFVRPEVNFSEFFLLEISPKYGQKKDIGLLNKKVREAHSILAIF